MKNKDIKICVVGLGYVGLPLAVEFGKIKDTLGFDTNEKRINNLRIGIDITNEKTKDELKSAKFLFFFIKC